MSDAINSQVVAAIGDAGRAGSYLSSPSRAQRIASGELIAVQE
jgi:hypothetical protein